MPSRIREWLRRRRNRLARRVVRHLPPRRPAVYIGDHRVLTRTVYGHPIVVDARDWNLSTALILEGVWEPHITDTILEILRPGMTVIDVGANSG